MNMYVVIVMKESDTIHTYNLQSIIIFGSLLKNHDKSKT